MEVGMLLGTGDVVDRYEVEGVLGEGGMAVVYAVRHAQLGTPHALKVLTVVTKQIRERLLQEGQVQARLRHRNVVAVTDVIDLEGSPGLIMERVDGPSLEAWLHHEQPALAQIDDLARQILDGIRVAHEQDLIHRDLKPANILMEIEKKRVIAKITDFGLAKLLRGSGTGFARTRTGSTMGTPHYMSPEQIRDSKGVGPQTDVFALGAILYEMLTGQRAFQGEDLLEIFNAVALGEYAPVSEFRDGVPGRMERAIEGALAVDPADRFPSVSALWDVWTQDAPSVVGVAWDRDSLARAASYSTEVEPSIAGIRRSASEEDVAAGGASADRVASAPASTLARRSGPVSISTRSLILGVGGMSVAGVIGFSMVVGVAGLLWWVSAGPEVVEGTPVEAPAVPPEMDPLEAAVLEAAADGDDPVVVEPAPRPRAPQPVPAAPVVPAPTPSDAVEGEAEPPSGAVASEDGDLPTVLEDEDSLEPALEDTDLPFEDTDLPFDAAVTAVAVDPVEEPVEVEAVVVMEPVPPPAEVAADLGEAAPIEELDATDPRASLPPDLRSQSTSIRMSGLAMRERDATATWVYDIVLKHDPHPDVRRKAWRTVTWRWRTNVGSPTEHAQIAEWVLNNGTADQQITAIVAIARSGRDVATLLPKLEDHRAGVRRAAVEGVVAMAERTGQAAQARAALQTRLEVETDKKTRSRLESGLQSL